MAETLDKVAYLTYLDNAIAALDRVSRNRNNRWARARMQAYEDMAERIRTGLFDTKEKEND